MSTEYEFKRNEYGDTMGCDSCGAEVPLAEFRKPWTRDNQNENQTSLKCDLCASTMIGTAADYPRQYSFVTPRMLAEAIHWLHAQLVPAPKDGGEGDTTNG